MGARSLFADNAARELLRRNGLPDLEAVFQRATDAHQRHTGRSVWDTHLDADSQSPIHVYVKMNWGRRRLWPRMTDLKTGQWLQSHPVREWHGIDTLGRLGIQVPERLALFHQGLLAFRAAVVVRAIPPAASVFDMLESGEWSQLSADDRQNVLGGIARVMRTIHSAGYGWRGTSVGHFYPQPDGDGAWTMWVIDCEGVHRRATVKTFARDDDKLIRSFELAGAGDATLATLADCLSTPDPALRPRAA